MNAKTERDLGRDTPLTRGILSADPNDLLQGAGVRVARAVLREAMLRLWSDDAFGLAGNIAFRALLAIFPFLIFASTLTAFVGDPSMADGLEEFLIAIVPQDLVEPILTEIEQVMTEQRGGLLSLGILLTIWFAVGGVDGVRVGLNRAYGIREGRSMLHLYAVQIAVVLVASLVLVLVGYLLVLAPRVGSWLHALLPGFDPASVTVGLIRYPAAAVLLLAALLLAHTVLPARRIRFSHLWPGVAFTLVAWMLLAAVFSYYLRNFASFASYYAGLAGIIAALYFMYLAALVLIFGGELNRALRIRRLARALGERNAARRGAAGRRLPAAVAGAAADHRRLMPQAGRGRDTMTLKHVLGTMLASRMAGRGGTRGGGLGTAAKLGLLGGRRGGLGGKAGLAALGYMAYEAYRNREAQAQARTGSRHEAGSGGGIAGILGDLADRFGFGDSRRGADQGAERPAEGVPSPEARQAAERFSDEKALLLIRAMIAAANADGHISPVERRRILQQLDDSGADSEDRRVVEREIANPRPLDELLAEVTDHETAQEFYLASRAAIDGASEAHRSYLATLRQRLGLSEAEAAEIEGLAS